MFSILSWYKFNCIQSKAVELMVDRLCLQVNIPECIQGVITEFIICPYCEILYENGECFCKILKYSTIKSVDFILSDDDESDED